MPKTSSKTKTRRAASSKTEEPTQAQPTQLKEGGVVYGIDDRVQYIGQDLIAYRGGKGRIVAVPKPGQAAVLLDGGTSPVIMPITDLIPDSDENTQADSAALMTSNKPRFRFIANTSGGEFGIPDLRSEVEEEGISLRAGEKIDLLKFFTVQQINRCQSLLAAVKTTSEQSGLPYITVLNSLDDPLPAGSIVIPLAQRTEPGTSLEAEANIYDEKIAEDVRKEEERNEKLMAKNVAARRTTRHGRSSSHTGGR